MARTAAVTTAPMMTFLLIAAYSSDQVAKHRGSCPQAPASRHHDVWHVIGKVAAEVHEKSPCGMPASATIGCYCHVEVSRAGSLYERGSLSMRWTGSPVDNLLSCGRNDPRTGRTTVAILLARQGRNSASDRTLSYSRTSSSVPLYALPPPKVSAPNWMGAAGRCQSRSRSDTVLTPLM